MHPSTSTWPSVPKDTDGAPADALRPSNPPHAHQQSQSQSQSETCPQPEPAPALMHFPHCRLEITTPSSGLVPTASQNTTAGKIEQVALPGTLVRTLLARFESQSQTPPTSQLQPHQPHNPTTATTTSRTARPNSSSSSSSSSSRLRLQQHFDDNDKWVFSRCLLADFTGFREDEAEALSRQGSLCCWASVVLQQSPTRGWDLGFVVHRIGVRDPRSGWCECF